jgi:polar amino acid transport system substrate-binding protein
MQFEIKSHFQENFFWGGAVIIFLLLFISPVLAQSQQSDVVIPNFWDPKNRPAKAVIPPQRAIRFLTEDDYPPFHFIDAEGRLAGFNVDIARALCEELKLSCTVQVRGWNTLVGALEQGQGDAIVASLAITPEVRQRLEFTTPYYRTPARFVVRKDSAPSIISPATFAGRSVAVMAGSAHEKFLRTFFPGVALRPANDIDTARNWVRRGEVAAMFGDGISLAFWLNGAEAQDCCQFAGGPYQESRFFGEGVGIAVRRDDTALRQALDYGLYRLWETGTYGRLYLKHFPLSFY